MWMRLPGRSMTLSWEQTGRKKERWECWRWRLWSNNAVIGRQKWTHVARGRKEHWHKTQTTTKKGNEDNVDVNNSDNEVNNKKMLQRQHKQTGKQIDREMKTLFTRTERKRDRHKRTRPKRNDDDNVDADNSAKEENSKKILRRRQKQTEELIDREMKTRLPGRWASQWAGSNAPAAEHDEDFDV